MDDCAESSKESRRPCILSSSGPCDGFGKCRALRFLVRVASWVLDCTSRLLSRLASARALSIRLVIYVRVLVSAPIVYALGICGTLSSDGWFPLSDAPTWICVLIFIILLLM